MNMDDLMRLLNQLIALQGGSASSQYVPPQVPSSPPPQAAPVRPTATGVGGVPGMLQDYLGGQYGQA